MRFSCLSVLSIVVPLVLAQDTSLAAVKRTFDAANIPGDLELTFEPSILLGVALPQVSGPPIRLHAGIHVPRNDTAGPPIFSILGGTSTKKGPFVIATVDPDAPTPQDPTSAQIRHFLGGNFVPEAHGALINTTAAISEFRQPTPPAGSDAHRYIFLLFEQPAGFNEQTFVNASTSISSFNFSAFAVEVGLGEPLGGTFMLVAPEPTTT